MEEPSGSGRARAFAAFFAEDYEGIVGSLGSRLRNPDLARDAVGEAVGRAWVLSRQGETIENLGAWIRTVATNVARDWPRRDAARARATARLPNTSSSESAMDLTNDVLFEQLVGQLSPRQREIVRLRYVEDLTHKEIGERLGISPGTVKSLLHRARATIAGVMLVLTVVVAAH